MTVADTADESDGARRRLIAGVLAAVGIAAVYVVGLGALVHQAGLAVLSPFQLYTLAFLLGVWTTIAATFVANYLYRRFFAARGVAYDLPAE